MKLIIRHKVAVSGSLPSSVTDGRSDQKLRNYIADQLTGLLRSMSETAQKDGLETGDVLVEVTDGGAK